MMRWRGSTRVLAAGFVLSLAVGGAARADSAAIGDTVVILGAGQVGSWVTTGYVANPNSAAIALTIPFSGPCPAACIPPSVRIPALGSVSFDVVLAGASEGFQTFYLTQVQPFPALDSGGRSVAATDSFPDVRPRLVDRLNPARSVDIPVVLLSQLVAANLSTLSFGGVTLDGPAHSNLVLGNVFWTGNYPEDLPVTLELFDSGGNLLGSRSLVVPYGDTALIGDVVSYLGAGSLSLGQLRVTRTGGGALMWGILYTVDAAGAVTSTAGARLSP